MDKFIKNIEEMPKDWQEKCKDGLKSQIEAQAIIIREDKPYEFLAYIEGEIAKASDSMNKLVSHIGLQGAVLGNISQAYVWNKERKRVLEKMKEDFLNAQEATSEPQQDCTSEPEQDFNPEPEQDFNSEPQQEKSELPDALNTERARLIFGGAIAKGWMLSNYEWVGLVDWGKSQQFCYMLGEIYGYKKGESGNEGESIPSTEIEKFFKISGFYSRLIKCWECKPQSWRTPIDEMIKEVTKST